jgi:FkbM family methyltransferase
MRISRAALSSAGTDFMSLRSQLVNAVHSFLDRKGFALVRLRDSFGLDPFSDIQKLSTAWASPISMVFDVGANNGATASAALKKFPDARVFSFEPHPATFAALIARIGNQARFRAVNTALGSVVGEVEMIEYEQSEINSLTPDARFAKRFGKQGCTIRVQSTTLDIFCAQNSIDHIDVLKIDTEGFDFVVLEGCRSMLERRAVKFIYVEFNDLQPNDGVFGGALLPFDNLLRPLGYRFVASYTDRVVTEGEMFTVSNALFALQPSLDSD